VIIERSSSAFSRGPRADGDVAIRILSGGGAFDRVPEDKEKAFLYATAARVAANARRSMKRRQNAYDNLAQVPDDPTPNQDQLSDQLRARALLDQVMAELPEDLREVFVLFEIEELSIQEIAETLDIPIGTVGSRLRRARQSFSEVVTRFKARTEFRLGARR
jgi:RNA polymerase sigma-70 factor (ECF subfamily)